MAHMVGGLDGSAAISGRVSQLSTAPDARLFRLMRTLADVVLVGANTVRQEHYGPVQLTPSQVDVRTAAGQRPTPVLAVVSASLDLDWTARAFVEAPPESRTLVITCGSANETRLREARAVADVVVAGEDRVDANGAMEALADLGHRVVLCEGGPTWLGQVVAADRLDELCLTVAPLIGGDLLPVSISPPNSPVRHFVLRHVMREGETLFLRYERAAGD